MANSDNAELSKNLIDQVYSMLDGEKIKQCLQCGTCSAACPVSDAMDYTPRKIIAALRAKQLDKVLKSNTPWLCASCYYCTVRCPAGIKFTDMMYKLKRLAIEHGLDTEDASILYQSFVKSVDKFGRSAEMPLMRDYYLKTNPFGLMKMAPLGMKMISKGRLHFKAEKIAGRQDIKKMLEYMREKGEM